MALLTVTERRWVGQHTKGTRRKPRKELAASETPSHTAGTAAVSRQGRVTETTKMLKMDNWGVESLEALQVTLRITGAGQLPLSGGKGIGLSLCGPHGPCLLLVSPLSRSPVITPRSMLGSFQKSEMERKGRTEARMGIVCWLPGLWV